MNTVHQNELIQTTNLNTFFWGASFQAVPNPLLALLDVFAPFSRHQLHIFFRTFVTRVKFFDQCFTAVIDDYDAIVHC